MPEQISTLQISASFQPERNAGVVKCAHRTAQEILALMQETGEEDPIRAIFAMLTNITIQQKFMLEKVEFMVRKLIELTKQRGASRG